ncbi:hypothetical protein J7E97_22275 [Streptomyces sp. ISL-66]|uniref:hypothetical protein n=1 Tax=Streptomyces sp. ISL-66 TaxID=2819186 RepID=UPI001BEAE38C|nr:hypothetical protein [Streptomyces sp. ISL-66]MBT2470522.1 hypothetical protein [Streptomyces sp. ISL-66]
MKQQLRSVAVATMVAAALAGCGGSGESGSPPMNGPGQASVPSERYRLQLPGAVLNGTFTGSDHSEPDQNIASMLSGQIDNGISAFAAYQPTDRKSQTSGPVLAVTGVYGTVLSPVTARDEFLKILDRRHTFPTQSTVIIGPRTIIPKGSSEPVSCRIVQETDEFGTTWGPDCSWADGSAVVDVTQSVDFTKQRPAEFDLEAFAAKTATIRNEVRAPMAP